MDRQDMTSLQAETQLRELVGEYFGRNALEAMLTEFLARLAEHHGMYLCEAQYEDVEFELNYRKVARRATCTECEWENESHAQDDYICLNCRAIATYFPERSSKDHDAYTSKDYDVYTSPAKDEDGNVLWLDRHSQWSSTYGHRERDVIFVRRPIPDSFELACRPLTSLAYEFLQYKSDTMKVEEPWTKDTATHLKMP